jgi:hypothetical protein
MTMPLARWAGKLTPGTADVYGICFKLFFRWSEYIPLSVNVRSTTKNKRKVKREFFHNIAFGDNCKPLLKRRSSRHLTSLTTWLTLTNSEGIRNCKAHIYHTALGPLIFILLLRRSRRGPPTLQPESLRQGLHAIWRSTSTLSLKAAL